MDAACENGIIIFDDPKHKPPQRRFYPQRVMAFMNEGKRIPAVISPICSRHGNNNAHRLIHIHKNVPGILAKINDVYARHNINIVGEFLVPTAQIGYVITDIIKGYDTVVLSELKAIEHTIKFRLLY